MDVLSNISTNPVGPSQFFRLLTEAATDIIWVADLTTLNVTYISPSVSEIRDSTPENIVNTPLLNLIEPQDRVRAKIMIEQALRDEKTSQSNPNRVYTLDYSSKHKNGSKAYLQANMRFLRDETGKPVAIYGISRNLTSERQIQEQLHQRNETISAIFDTIPYIAFLLDHDNRIVDANSEGMQLVEFSDKKDIINLKLGEAFGCKYSYVEEEDKHRVSEKCADCPIIKQLKHTLETGESIFEAESLMDCVSNKTVHGHCLLVSTALIKTQDGDRILMLVKDNTEAYEARKVLAKSEKRYIALFDFSPVAMLEGDLSKFKACVDNIRKEKTDDVYTYLLQNPKLLASCSNEIDVLHVNQNMLTLLQVDELPLVLEHIATYFDQKSAAVFVRGLLALCDGAKRFDGEMYLKSDGEIERVLHTSMSVIPGHEEILARVMCSMHDITDKTENIRMKEELLETERNISQTLRRSLVPTEFPEFEGCTLSVQHRPAQVNAQIGGDFYDVFALSRNRLGILIGDVVGKGLDAANRIAAARYTIRSYAFLNSSPSWVLTQANNALCRDVDEESFLSLTFTAFYLVIDTSRQTVRFASGGNEPPIVKQTDGNIHQLVVPGQMMGVWPNHIFQESEQMLGFGDMLVMTTDGITESRSSTGEYFGHEGVIKYVNRTQERSISLVTAGIMDAAVQHAGGSLIDDAVVIGVSFEGN